MKLILYSQHNNNDTSESFPYSVDVVLIITTLTTKKCTKRNDEDNVPCYADI